MAYSTTGVGGSSMGGGVPNFNAAFGMFGPTSGGGSQPIGQGINFANISSGQGGLPLFGGTPVTGGYQNQPMSGAGSPYGVAPQPMSGSDNSLTAFFRGLTNLQGTTAPSFIQAGENLIQGGLGAVQPGLNMQGTGFGTTEAGLATLAPSVQFYSKLLSGDPQAAANALAPTAANAAQLTAGALNNLRATPLGGYGALEANLRPQQLAGQLSSALYQLQPAAAAELGKLGPAISTIGTQQAGIGRGFAETGLDVSRLGQALAQMGFQFTQADIQDLLEKMRINQAAPGPLDTLSKILGIGSQLIGPAKNLINRGNVNPGPGGNLSTLPGGYTDPNNPYNPVGGVSPTDPTGTATSTFGGPVSDPSQIDPTTGLPYYQPYGNPYGDPYGYGGGGGGDGTFSDAGNLVS